MNDTITLDTAQAQLADAERALRAAVKAFESANDGKHDITAMIEAGDVVKAATANRSKAENAVKAVQFAEGAAARGEIVARLHDAIQTAVMADREALRALGVETLTIAALDLTTDTPTPVSINPRGPELKAPRGPRGGGGNGGFKSAGAVIVNGTTYRSQNAAYVALRAEADGKEPGDVTPANSESAGRWLEKHGFTVESAPATTE